MSTAGSTRSGESSQYTPPAAGAGGETDAPRKKRTSWVRWQGLIPIVLLFVLLVVGWAIFGDRAVRRAIIEAGDVLGTQLDVGTVNASILNTSFEVRGFAMADPFDVNKNLIEVSRFVVELEPKPLLQKKYVVKRLTVADVRMGTKRAVPARPVRPTGATAQLAARARSFASAIKLPTLSLAPLDSLKDLVLNPSQLKAVQAALALGTDVDSARARLNTGYAGLRLQQTLDSSAALANRLQNANFRTLGLEGLRTAVADVRRGIARIDSAKTRVDRLVGDTKRSVDSLQAGVAAIDDARREDYDFARGLLKLPNLETPDIGASLFGAVTIDKFQQAVYWASVARQYTPPGLLPKEQPGPKRVRASGTTVQFVKPESYPTFLLRRADLTFEMPNVGGGGQYSMAISDATTEPTVLGRPTLFAIRRTTKTSPNDSVKVLGSLDHLGARPRETVNAAATGIPLPAFAVPSLPFTMNPGRGATELRFVLDGEQITGRWSVRSTNLSWQTDSSRARRLNSMESIVARVLTGITELEVTADISGTVQAPRLAVRSNLDRQVGDRLRAVAGQEIAAATARVRAQVDRLVEEKSAPVKARITEVRAEGEQRVADARAKLDAEKRKLEDRLRSLTSGLPPGIRLPGI
jgi:uncharacterized protein (TIGR03545 family)